MTDMQTKKLPSNHECVNINIVHLSSISDPLSKAKHFELQHMMINCWKEHDRVKFIIIALGIFFSYLCVGIFHEKIMKTRYGNEKNADGSIGETYTYANTLAGVSILSGFIFIGAWSLLKPQKRDDTPLAYYIGAAVVNNLSMVTAYAALKWVSYPTQVILKSGKPISVMLFGVLICKRYTTQRYFFVVLVVIGVIIFNLHKSNEKIQAIDENSNEMLGISLLVMSITMDGVLGMIQDKIRVAHSPTSQQMMLSMNAWGTGIILILLIVTHEIVDVFHFMCRHNEVLWHMGIFGVSGAFGQIFLYSMISYFGSLACSITTTVRKFISVVVSTIIYGHPSNAIQWSGAALMFSALLADAFFGNKKKDNNSGYDAKDQSTNADDINQSKNTADKKPDKNIGDA